MWLGDLFQSFGPTTLHDLDVNVCLTVFRTISLSFMLLDLKSWVSSGHLTSKLLG